MKGHQANYSRLLPWLQGFTWGNKITSALYIKQPALKNR